MNQVLVNKETFNLKSVITDDWGGSHRIAIDLEALNNTSDWKFGIDIPSDYKIDQIYGAKLTQENGQAYLTGEDWNQSMNAGDKTEIILIIDEGNSSASAPVAAQYLFADSATNYTQSSSAINADSQITEDWSGGYKLELNLTAETNANNWEVNFNTPHSIKEVYGVDLVDNGNGNYTIKGQNDQANLQQGQSIKPVFIIEDGGQQAQEFDIVDSYSASEETQAPASVVEPEPAAPTEASGTLSATPSITEDWTGGYKLELEIRAESNADNWEVDFNLPYSIKEVYGVDLVDNGNGNYTISGQNDQESLASGQSIKPVFIIEDGGGEAVTPEFGDTVDVVAPEPIAQPVAAPSNSQVSIANDTGTSVGQSGQFAYGEALQKNFLFLEANRSGILGPDNRIEWRSDATVNDGSTVGRDLEGGYFDAGDHVKFGQPMAASVNMLAWGGIEYTDAYKSSGQFDELLEAVKWGTDYFLKAHETSGGKTDKLWVQVGEGGVANDHGYWGAPETVEANTTRNAFYIDASNPGSDVAASTSSALAAASMLFRGVDDVYADELLKNATELYEFAETYQGKYSDSVSAANPFYTSWSGYGDELASGAAWLHKATGEQSYLTKAENHFKQRVGGLGDWSWAVDDHSYGAAVILAQESDDSYFQGQVEAWLDKWINGNGNINYTQGGFAHRAEWGSIPVTSSAAYLAQLYNDTVKEDSRYSEFANNQVDYILGDNPKNYSYMVGFGDNHPERVHHRGSSPNLGGNPEAIQENILYGAVVGGPRDANDYSHYDRRDDAITNEVGTSYNAPFASALIQQYDNLGGDPLSESELDQLIGIDANGVGF